MTKINAKYILIKFVTVALIALICVGVSLVASLIFGTLGDDQHLQMTLVSACSFAAFSLIYFGIVKKANVRKISRINFILGDTAAFAIYALIGGIIAGVVDGALYSWVSFFFLPALFFVYLTDITALGIALHVLAFALVAWAGWSVSKKRDERERALASGKTERDDA